MTAGHSNVRALSIAATEQNASSPMNAERLAELASDVVARARAAGADQVEVSVSIEHGLAVNARMRDVETVEFTRDRGLTLTVYRQGRKAVASTGDLGEASLAATIDQALAIARFAEADPHAGLPDPNDLATEFRELDLYHPTPVDADAAIERVLACDAAGLDADPRISNSDGSAFSQTESFGILANSHGFVGADRSTGFSVSSSMVAGHGEGMERDHDFDVALSLDALAPPQAIGERAATKAVQRLGAGRPPSGPTAIVFSPDVSRGLIGHLFAALSGPAQYRRASFLLRAAGETVLPTAFSIVERPHLVRGLRSANFDAEGVATRESAIIEAGVVARYLLGSYSARRLGLATTGNAGGVHNVEVIGASGDLAEFAQQIDQGIVVTELMGQGADILTGDYSRGAAGFMVEGGRITRPVSEFTIAGNLRPMLAGILGIGTDVDLRSPMRVGSILIDRMAVAAG